VVACGRSRWRLACLFQTLLFTGRLADRLGVRY